MKLIDRWEDVRSQQDAINYARSKGAKVEHETGHYYRITTDRGTVHIYDSCKAEPKQAREWLRFLFWSLGLVSLIALVLNVGF